jgi:hypothetical protein
MDTGEAAPVGVMQALFAESVSLAIDDAPVPVLFKKEAPDTMKYIQGQHLVNLLLSLTHNLEEIFQLLWHTYCKNKPSNY